MPQDQNSLDDLRAEIDGIDDRIHALILDRVAVVERIKAIKGSQGPAIRADREALLLRRRYAAHSGPLPFVVIGRIWRELVGAMTVLQAPLSVAVLAPDGKRGLWDQARDHFGSVAKLLPVPTAVAAVRLVADGGATVGIVPLPDEDEVDSWWKLLIEGDGQVPRIIGRLPFVGRGNGRAEESDALVIAQLPPAPTGDDRSFVVLELDGAMSRGAFKTLLEARGLIATNLWTRGGERGQPALNLVEVEGFVATDDHRLALLRAELDDKLMRWAVLGSYPMPIEMSEAEAAAQAKAGRGGRGKSA